VRFPNDWVGRIGQYRYRQHGPYYVYYRRTNCPSRWSSLPRYWSSVDRHRIREYFGGVTEHPYSRSTGPAGGTAIEKDRDYREKADRWQARSNPPAPERLDQGESRRGSARWKDNGDVIRRKESGRESRFEDPQGSRMERPPTQEEGPPPMTRDQAPPDAQGTRRPRDTWITDLLRGTGSRDRHGPVAQQGRSDDGGKQKGQTAPPRSPRSNGPAQSKDEDRRSK